MSRRSLLAGAGAVGAALVAAACGSDEDSTRTTTGATTPAPQASTPATEAGMPGATGGTSGSTAAAGSDLQVAQLAAGLEVLAVNTYKSALDAAGSGALGDVPPAVAEYVSTAMAQHQAHLDAWNDVITGGGGQAVTEPNAELEPVVAEELGKVKDAGGAAKLALMLEQIASATYLEALPMLQDKDAIELAGSIQIIDMQHQSILLYALGEYPVPDTFAPVEKSVA
jgi:hypothetical protein